WFDDSVPRNVPDNLKTVVISHPREGEIILNDAYRELAAHYSAAVLPGRVRKPKDKASVESTVGNIATQAIAALRGQTFQTLPQLREAIYLRMQAYNAPPLQKRPRSGHRSSPPSNGPCCCLLQRSLMRSVAGFMAGSSAKTGMWCS